MQTVARVLGGRLFLGQSVIHPACGALGDCHILRAMMFRVTMTNDPDRDDGDLGETGVATRTRPRTKKPSNYKVLMLNDDYTPMEFVVLVLQQFFSMSIEDATR